MCRIPYIGYCITQYLYIYILIFKTNSTFSTVCSIMQVNFGDVKIPYNLNYPKPQKIDRLSGIHGVSSENIVVVDAQTLLIPGFSYDGEAPGEIDPATVQPTIIGYKTTFIFVSTTIRCCINAVYIEFAGSACIIFNKTVLHFKYTYPVVYF